MIYYKKHLKYIMNSEKIKNIKKNKKNFTLIKFNIIFDII